MYDIKLRKGGRLFVKVWNSKQEDYKEIEVDYNDISVHLHDFICFDMDIRLKDLFLLFKRNINVFSIATGCPFLNNIVEESMLPSSSTKESGLGGVVVSWLAYKESGGEFNESDHLYSCPVMNGVGLNIDFDLRVVRVNQISSMPVILDTSFEIVDSNGLEISFKGNKPFTLIEVSKAVMDELGFNSPEIRNCIDGADILEGTVLTISEKLEEHIKNSHKHEVCKTCGKDAKSYHFKKPKHICGICFEKEKDN